MRSLDSGIAKRRLGASAGALSRGCFRDPLCGIRYPVAHDGVDHLHPLSGRGLQGTLVLHALGQAFPHVLAVVSLRPAQRVAREYEQVLERLVAAAVAAVVVDRGAGLLRGRGEPAVAGDVPAQQDLPVAVDGVGPVGELPRVEPQEGFVLARERCVGLGCSASSARRIGCPGRSRSRGSCSCRTGS